MVSGGGSAVQLIDYDGMYVDDDPEQGIIDGTSFTHPDLRIQFNVPAGFMMSNGTRAVTISGSAGKAQFGGGGGYPRRLRRDDLAERPGGEFGDLERRGLGRRVLQPPAPAGVVPVMPGPVSMRFGLAEARDRAVDRGLRDVVRPDPEPRGHSGPESFEHDVGARAERSREHRIAR